ncbi:MAG: DPP IV N-terminal domain-containing protein, partial [Flavobacteriales bacterium]|nr:DPP IV N-terminal domain-containing protein [Flavobacteriales bacterium]
MNKFFLTACLAVSISALCAQQKLTLEEAVLGQGRQFAPETLVQLQWLPASDSYVFVRDNALVHTTIKGKESILFNLETLNGWKGGTAMDGMPQITWLTAMRFWFNHDGTYYEGDLKTRKVRSMNTGPKGVANEDYHAMSGNLAFTRDNNLFVSVNGKEQAVTSLAAGHVAGQSISRNEYGIGKGTFWSEKGNKLAFYQKDETQV